MEEEKLRQQCMLLYQELIRTHSVYSIDLIYKFESWITWISPLAMTKLKDAIEMVGTYCVPVTPLVVPLEFVQIAMINFNHHEKTLSSIGRSHNTILILFRKIKNAETCNEQLQISQKDVLIKQIIKGLLNMF